MGELDDYTADHYGHAIAEAIKVGDTEAVEALLHLMAVRYPHEAEKVIDVMRLGLAIGGKAND